MSFPKARILRFNEISTCAPPPGKYDPKYDNKVKGAVIEKCKRFVEGKSEPAPSVTSQDSASSCSHGYNPAVTFRTPQLPRKKIISTPRSAIERNSRFQKQLTPTSECKSKKRLEYETEKNLIEQINELTRVHTSQLLDKDQELAALQQELAELRISLSKAENNHIKDYNVMKQQYEKEIKTMKSELDEVVKTAEAKRAESETLIAELHTQVKVLEENVKNCNAMNGDLEYLLAETNINMIELRNEYADIEKQLKSARETINFMINEKKEDLKQFSELYPAQLEKVAVTAETNIDELAANMKEKLSVLERELDIERFESHRAFFSKIDSLADDVKDRVDLFESRSSSLQLTIKTMADDFDQKISDLVESISNYMEMGETKLKENLKLTDDLERARASCLENKITIVDLESKVEELQSDLAHLTNQCRKFEIVQNEASKTIQVLSQRLFESESEVERLNDKTEELHLRKDALEEKVKAVVNENSILKIKINELQVSLVRDVKEVENVLISKVDSYRRLALEETQKFKYELDEKQRTVEMLMAEVEFYRAKSSEANEYITLCQNRIANYKQEVQNLTKNFTSLEEDYNDKLNAQKVLVIGVTNEFESFRKNAEKKEDHLQNKVTDIIAENSKLRSELNALLTQKAEMQSQIDVLENAKGELVQECETSRDHVVNLEKEIDINSSLVAKMTSECEALKLELDERKYLVSQLEKKIYDFEENNKGLNEEVASLTKEMKCLNEISKEQAEKLHDKDLSLESISQEMEECKRHNECLTSRIVGLTNDILVKEALCQNLSEDVEVKNLTLVQVSEEYERMKTMYEDECKKAEELERDNLKYIGELVSDLIVEKQRCAEMNAMLEERRVTISGFQDNVNLLKGELESKIKERNELSEQVTKMEQSSIEMSDEFLRVSNEKSVLEFRILELEKILRQKEEEKSDLVKEKDDLVEIVKRQWDERELLTNQITSQQEEILELKQLKDERFEEEKAIYQAELQNEIFALQQNLEDTQKHAIDLKSRNDELIFKLNSAETELTEAETEKERQESNLKELIENLSSLETMFAGMEKRKNEYKMYATELEAEKSSLKQQVDELTEEKERMLEDKKEVSMQLTSQTARLADLDCRSNEAEAKCRELELHIDELSSRNAELENMVGPFQDQLKQFEKERAQLQAKHASTEKELKAMTMEHAKVLGHQNNKQKIRYVIQLSESMANLKKENEKLLAENNKLRATILAQQGSSMKRCNKTKKDDNDKENVENVTALKSKEPEAENQRKNPSQASPLKMRNVP